MKKKITITLVSMLIAVILGIIPSNVKAKTTLTTPLYFGIQEFRSGTTPENLAYAIHNPLANGPTQESIVGTKIWQIVKYDNATTDRYNTGNYYCVRSGVGFSDTNKKAVYNITYDLKTEKQALINSGNSVLQKIATNGYYDYLLALTDIMYLKGISTPEEKAALLDAARIYAENYKYAITDSDIEAVQQAAIWYFTNHDDTLFEKLFNNLGTNKTSWLNYRTLAMSQDGEQYRSLSDYNKETNSFGGKAGEGKDRQEQAVLLYNYLINKATDNVTKGITNSRVKVTLYANATEENTQPIISIEKTPEEVKEFDLALRKYITKIDNNLLTGRDSRVPDIDLTSLNNGTTAKYKHRKDPRIVKNGSIVTYNLTVYNEGEKAGRATQIIDQLPEGLKFSKINTAGFSANYDENLNRVTITRDATNTTNLEAYKTNDLKSETIEIECEVTAEANTQSDTILTNVAWISKEYDAVSKQEIITEQGKDRDSEPGTVPNVNKTNMSNYTGNGNKADLTDRTEYYKGQQDDDDFEKLILEKENDGVYNIILVKEDKDGEQLNSTATFDVNNEIKPVTGRLTIVENVQITSENVNEIDTYVIKETKAPDEYCEFNGIITIKVYKKLEGEKYKADRIEYTVTDEHGNDIKEQTKDTAKVYLNSNGNIYVEVKNYQFDLKLVKRIIEKNGVKVPERIIGVDVTNLANGTETTADYNLDKSYVSVKQGDIVKYALRVYNEGEIDGYASEISEDVPEGLEFMWSENEGKDLEDDTTLTEAEKEAIKYNQGIWDIKTLNKETNRIEMITTDYLAKEQGAEFENDGANLIKAFDSSKGYINNINEKNPDYREVYVYMKVVSEDVAGKVIRNEAAITHDTDKDGNEVDDRDSHTDVWKKYEDDEDYDNVILQQFDLALRKFITAIGENEVITRIPEVEYDKENDKITYKHTKVPMDVVTNDIVTYTIRVYNEGEIDGFASKISDDIPEGLEYLPDNNLNKEYRWLMYDEDGKQTDDVKKAVKLTTDYLSKEQGEARMKKDTNLTENPALLSAFNASEEISDTNPDYADVKIAFKVVEKNGSDKIIINSAQISDDTDKDGNPIKDDDSTTDKWIDGEDDQDKEYIKLTYFDLALRKWVTHAIVIDNGKETVTPTGHKPEDDPEQVVKVEVNRKKINSVTVKFKYSIRITNEGDIAGYAKEIKDYIPAGLKFVAKDNPDWKDEGNNIISTRKLENKLLQPGESADVEVLLTWINGKNNMGLKVNTAEISEDYNDKKVPDRDSTPNNKKPGEDDIDDAPVLLSTSTGSAKLYGTLILSVLITIAGGIVLIKKFIL